MSEPAYAGSFILASQLSKIDSKCTSYGRDIMAGCRKCGAGGANVTPAKSSGATSEQMVLLEYIGKPEQKQRLRSKVNPREQYVFGGGVRRFRVYAGDVDWLTAMKHMFVVAEMPMPEPQEVSGAGIPVLTSAAKVVDLPVEALTIDPITLSLLKKKFNTVDELRRAGRAEWMTIKGVGATRADQIEVAINALQR